MRLKVVEYKKLERLQKNLQEDNVNNFDGDWWKNERWNFGKKCKGWTIFQIFKIEPDYLRWIVDNFQLTLVSMKTRKAIYKAVEILDNKKSLSFQNEINTVYELNQQKNLNERGVL